MNEHLRGCPLCGTPVEELQLGLRDYRWLGDALPGRVAPMDLDCVLEKNGRFLVLEFKPGGAPLPMGQRLTLRALVRTGADVWVVWEKPDDTGHVDVAVMDRHGSTKFTARITVSKLRSKVSEWYTEATQEGSA